MADTADTTDTAMALPQQQDASRAATAIAGDVSARLQQALSLLFPSNLAAKAALFALVVALLPLLPTGRAPGIWELPHLLLLGIIISYGVFGQKNADAEVAMATTSDDARKPVDDEAAVEAYVAQMMQGSLVFEDDGRDRDGDGGGGASKDGVEAWSFQYLPDDPLVVVADATGINSRDGGTGEKPLLLPVRKLKPAAEESPAAALTDDIVSDDIEDDEKEEAEPFLAPKAGYDGGVRERVPSPSSVLDADMTLSPPSSPPLLPPPPPPPPPPFLDRGRSLRKAKARSFNEFGATGSRAANERLGWNGVVDGKQFRSKSAVQATRRAFSGYEPVVPIDDDAAVEDDLDEEEVVAASESSFSSDDERVENMFGEDVREENVFEEDEVEEAVEEEDGSSCDEELLELATRPGLEVEEEQEEEEEEEDEVDRKADEFIAKFREQIRMQRVEPARR